MVKATHRRVKWIIEKLPPEALGWTVEEIEKWASALADAHEWYVGDLQAAVKDWRRRVRRRLEDRIRKDPVALAAAAAAVRVSLV